MLTFYHLIIFFFSNLIIINLISLQIIYNRLNFNKKNEILYSIREIFCLEKHKKRDDFHFKNNCF